MNRGVNDFSTRALGCTQGFITNPVGCKNKGYILMISLGVRANMSETG